MLISSKLNFETELDCRNFLKKSFGFIPQYTGDEVHYVESKENDIANFGSRTTGGLGSHNDGYDYETVPEFIALFCIESDCEGGETYQSDFRKALSLLTPNEVKTLFSETFMFQTEPAIHHNTPNSGITAAIMNSDVIRFSYSYIKRLVVDNKDFNMVIDKLNEMLIENKQSVKLNPGELIILNNRDFVYGRSAFSGTRKLARYWLSSPPDGEFSFPIS